MYLVHAFQVDTSLSDLHNVRVLISFQQKVNMKKLAIAAAITVIASSAMAQASNFTGWSAGANLNFVSASVDLDISGTGFKQGDASQNFSLQAAHGFAIDSKSVLTLGGTYSIGNMKAGSVHDSNGDGYEIKGKNMYSVYVEPGYLVSDTTLAYGKLAYSSMKGELSVSTGDTGSETFKGFGYGAGIRTMLDKTTFIQVEVVQTKYDSKSDGGLTAKPSATVGSIGFGVKF